MADDTNAQQPTPTPRRFSLIGTRRGSANGRAGKRLSSEAKRGLVELREKTRTITGIERKVKKG